MNILFNIIGLLILWAGEYWDYAVTMKLNRAGWLNTEINQFGQHVKSKEKRKFFMKDGVFLEDRFKLAKLIFTLAATLATILIFIFTNGIFYQIAAFVFNLIVGIAHLQLGYSNNRNYEYIKEVLGRK